MEKRLTEVEIAVCHIERLVEELNQVVIEQARTIQRLSKRIQMVEERAGAAGEEAANEPPPHY